MRAGPCLRLPDAQLTGASPTLLHGRRRRLPRPGHAFEHRPSPGRVFFPSFSANSVVELTFPSQYFSVPSVLTRESAESATPFSEVYQCPLRALALPARVDLLDTPVRTGATRRSTAEETDILH